VSDYDPGATGGDQPWGPPQSPPQPTGGWGAPPGAGSAPGPSYGGPSYGDQAYGGQPPPGGGQQLPPYSQFSSPQQANWGAPSPGLGQLADWAPRAGGFVIDWLIIFVPSLVLDILTSATNSDFFEVLAYIWGIGMWVWFSVQVGTTGSSPGMRTVGLKCVSKATGQNIGTGTAILRWVLHIVDSIICFIGWFWPLWDSQRQTLSDKIVGSLVYRVPPEGFSLLPKRRPS
jgi:RDD family